MIGRALDGLGYASNAKVRDFVGQLEEAYLALHPMSGQAWLDWYDQTVKGIVRRIEQEPVSIQRVIYNAIFHRVIQPTGESLEPKEVDRAMKNLKAMVDDLAEYYGLDNDLPPSPAIEPLGLLRAGRR